MSSRKPKKSEKKRPVRAATRERMSTKKINELSDDYHRKYPPALVCCSGWIRNRPIWHKALMRWLNENSGTFPGDKWLYCPWCGKRRIEKNEVLIHEQTKI